MKYIAKELCKIPNNQNNNTDQIAKRNTYAWWIISLYFYGIIDAYVDYSLKNFPHENKKEE